MRRRATVSVAAVLTVCVAAGASIAAIHPADPATSVPAAEQSDLTTKKLQAQIDTAVNAKSWPADLTPTLDGAREDASPAMHDPACFNPADLTDDTACTVGSGDKLAMVTGDSIAMAWQPALRAALGKGWRVHAMGFSNCPLVDADVVFGKTPEQTVLCSQNRQARIDQIKRLHPDVLVVSDLERHILRLADGATGDQAIAEWSAARERIFTQLSGYVGKIVLLSPNPVGPTLGCADAGAPPANCTAPISDVWQAKAEADRVAAAASGVTYIDPSAWFCTDKGVCPPFVGKILVRWDAGHITQTYARYLAPLLRDKLRI